MEGRTRSRISIVCGYCEKNRNRSDKAKAKCHNCNRFKLPCSYILAKRRDSRDNSKTYKNRGFDLANSDNIDNKSVFGGLLMNFNESNGSILKLNRNHSDCNPLSTMKWYKQDAYIQLFITYLIITLKRHTIGLSEPLKENWITSHSNNISKWIILLKIGQDDQQSIKSISNIVNERQLLVKMNFFPFLTLEDSNDGNIDLLKKKIQDVLPSKNLTEKYMWFFFHYLWPMRPFIDELQFKEKLSRIINYNNQEPSLLLSHRSDLAIISIFLIILRYSSTAIQIIDDENTNDVLSELKAYPISVNSITTAQLCLSFYKVAKKTTLEIFQALLYLRFYLKDSPENGDLSLTRNQHLMGFIAQSAISMGLNRDPVNYTQTKNNAVETNLRRKLWYSLMDLDLRTIILSGSLSVLPKRQLVNVEYPVILSADGLEMIQSEDIKKQSALHKRYEELMRIIKKDTNWDRLISLLYETDDYIEHNFGIELLIPLEGILRDYKQHLSANLSNVTTYIINLTHLNLKVQVHMLICEYFENNSHRNLELYQIHMLEVFLILKDIIDLGISYLMGNFKTFIDPIYNFEILPILNVTFFRVFTIISVLLIRLVHCLVFFTQSGEHEVNKLTNLIDTLLQISNTAINIYNLKIGSTYNSSLKIMVMYQFGLDCLKSFRSQDFNSLFVEKNINDPELNFILRDWMLLKDSTISNLNASNVFTLLSDEFINELSNTFEESFYHCPEFTTLLNPLPNAAIEADNYYEDEHLDLNKGLKALESLSMLESFAIEEDLFGQIFKSIGKVDSSILQDFRKYF